jgi:hypothetical protein
MSPELRVFLFFMREKDKKKCACLLAKLRRLRYLHWHVFVFPSTFNLLGRPAGSLLRVLMFALEYVRVACTLYVLH